MSTTSAALTPGATSRRGRRVAAKGGERRGVDRAVLADLERREVEPERRELPAQVLDLAPGDAGQAVGDERVLDLGQLDVQLRPPIRSGR